MKEIRLHRLTLDHFQGGTFTFNPEGADTYCYGENGSGKTRLVSAFSWVLWGKDSLGRADFSIKNLDSTGEPEHNIEHSSEIILSVDGMPITMKKTFSEVWQKKRGSAKSTFTGHTNGFYIDGVPIQEKDYVSRIGEIAGDESRFRLLTSPSVFPAMHWQKQRALLLEICGDITDRDVIASDEKLFPLTAILGKHTLDDHRKVVTARRSEINKTMVTLPIRIDEVRRSLPDVTGLDCKACEIDTQRIEAVLNDAKMRLQGVNTGGNIADLTKRLSGLNADLRKMEDKHRSGSLTTLNRLNQLISEAEVKVNASRRRVEAINGDLRAKDAGIKSIEMQLSMMRDKWTSIDAEVHEHYVINDTCPSCGQALPETQVQTAREKALASFNQSKAERLGEIEKKGHTLKDQRDRLRAEIEALGKEREILSESLLVQEAKLKTLTEERDDLKRTSENFGDVQGRAELLDEIDGLEGQIQEEREGKAVDIEKMKTEIGLIEFNLTEAKAKVDMFVRREQGEKRINELKVDEKKLSTEFERLESELYLMDAFIRAKVSMLTAKINEKFETVRFKLFEEQINGALAEVCKITVNGVPFDGGLNNGARINAGLEIVKVLQEHYQLRAPVFADNAEAVNTVFDVGSQMIRLYVSEDRELRVEVKG